MRMSLLGLIACAALIPVRANANGDTIASCHLTYAWVISPGPATDGPVTTDAKDYRLTRGEIAKLPDFREVKIVVNASGEVASPAFKGEVICETNDAVIRYEGTFTKAIFRDTFVQKKSGPAVFVPPAMQLNGAAEGIPASGTLPSGLELGWGGGNVDEYTARPDKCFGVVVQLYDRHTQWLRARFTGTCTKKSKSLFGGTSSQQFHDAAIVFPANHAATAMVMVSAPFRF
jgi:hypothetical protein